MSSVRRIRTGEGQALRAVRLRALQTDPQAFAATHSQSSSSDDHVWEEMAAAGASGDQEVLFVVDGGEGFVAMVGAFTRPDEPATRHLYGMWVAPEVRGSGIGRGLIDAVVRWTREVGGNEVRLWVVESNTPAVRLYESAGFVPTGETQPLPSRPELTDVRMRLALD
jgi:GNAT superfamily N-acetyltransferase